MSGKEEIVEAAASAAASAAVAHIEAAETSAEQVIEAAAAKVDAAQEIAEKVTQAAVETSLGERISNLEGKVTTWHENQNSQMMEMRSTLETVTAKMTDLSGQMLTLLTTLKPSPELTPPASEPVQKAVEEVLADPTKVVTAEIVEPTKEAAQKVQEITVSARPLRRVI